MMTTSLAIKLAAGATAALTAGGGVLAATGDLPDPAQRTVADGAARIGLDLPGASLDAGAQGRVDEDGSSLTDAITDALTGSVTGEGTISGTNPGGSGSVSGEGSTSGTGAGSAEVDMTAELEGEVDATG